MRRLIFALTAVFVLASMATSAGSAGNKTGQACYKGMHAYYQDPSTGRPFASQDACVSYVAKGGTLTPEVDVSLALDKSSQSAGTFAVHNGGLVSVTVTIEASFVWSSLEASGEVVADAAQCTYTHDAAGQTVDAFCSATVGAGGTVDFLDVDVTGGASVRGAASVSGVSPSYPDPTSSNNVVFWSLSS